MSVRNRCSERSAGAVRCDLGIRNSAEPLFRFEALKGRLHFSREGEAWLQFHSRICRESEHHLHRCERRRLYRPITRLRNLIVHECEETDPSLPYTVITTQLSDILRFRDEIDPADHT